MLNSITIMGRLVRDPELRYTQSGIPVASFTLAVDRDFKSEGGDRETDFIDCVAWRSTGEFVDKYFSKGSMAAVSGRLQLRDWQDKDGNKRRNAEIVVSNVYFGSTKKSEENTQTGSTRWDKNEKYSSGSTSAKDTSFSEIDGGGDGDLPF